jgi:hypothetical protein
LRGPSGFQHQSTVTPKPSGDESFIRRALSNKSMSDSEILQQANARLTPAAIYISSYT